MTRTKFRRLHRPELKRSHPLPSTLFGNGWQTYEDEQPVWKCLPPSPNSRMFKAISVRLLSDFWGRMWVNFSGRAQPPSHEFQALSPRTLSPHYVRPARCPSLRSFPSSDSHISPYFAISKQMQGHCLLLILWDNWLTRSEGVLFMCTEKGRSPIPILVWKFPIAVKFKLPCHFNPKEESFPRLPRM